jgi:hypothetical protein
MSMSKALVEPPAASLFMGLGMSIAKCGELTAWIPKGGPAAFSCPETGYKINESFGSASSELHDLYTQSFIGIRTRRIAIDSFPP